MSPCEPTGKDIVRPRYRDALARWVPYFLRHGARKPMGQLPVYMYSMYPGKIYICVACYRAISALRTGHGHISRLGLRL